MDDGKHSYFRIRDEKDKLDALKQQNPGTDPYELRYIIDNYVRTKGYFPTDSVVVHVNAENVRNQGIIFMRSDVGISLTKYL